MLTQYQIKELLHYDPDIGIFTNKTRRGGRSIKGAESGGINNRGYIQIWIDNKLYSAHRLVFLYMNGKFPTDQVDHINGVKINNKWKNLREVTNQENNKNRKIPSSNKSGVMGVCLFANTKKWCARITVDGKKHNLGTFRDFFEACCSRKSAELKYGYHENHGRN